MKKVLVIDIPGLTPALLGEETPHLSSLASTGFSCPMETVFPAVTCTVQSTLLTGLMPSEHGIVGNGWYWRDLGEVFFWRQPDRLVGGDRIWDEARKKDPSFSAARLFWWFSMDMNVDVAVTPRPCYGAAGRKVPDIWTRPRHLREDIQEKLGPFPLFHFWGPKAGIRSTKWIVDATNYVMENQTPTLLLTYLPHLDYDFQRYGPDDPRSRKALAEVDAQAGRLIGYGRAQGFEVVVVSEYGIQPVSGAVFLNRFLREADFLEVRETPFGEILDPIASKAFAVVDHQAAHVYVADPKDVGRVRGVLSELPGVDRVLDEEGQERMGIRHSRSGELVLVAEEGRWFAYPWWLEDDLAPDFAATVDIHRKPGYDPGELFMGTGKFHAAWKLLLKKVGFRVLLDVVPLDPSMVGGSHGRLPGKSWDGPVLICSSSEPAVDGIHAKDFRRWLIDFMAAS